MKTLDQRLSKSDKYEMRQRIHHMRKVGVFRGGAVVMVGVFRGGAVVMVGVSWGGVVVMVGVSREGQL